MTKIWGAIVRLSVCLDTESIILSMYFVQLRLRRCALSLPLIPNTPSWSKRRSKPWIHARGSHPRPYGIISERPTRRWMYTGWRTWSVRPWRRSWARANSCALRTPNSRERRNTGYRNFIFFIIISFVLFLFFKGLWKVSWSISTGFCLCDKARAKV